MKTARNPDYAAPKELDVCLRLILQIGLAYGAGGIWWLVMSGGRVSTSRGRKGIPAEGATAWDGVVAGGFSPAGFVSV